MDLVRTSHVSFGSKADIELRLPDVRFTPKSGHRSRRNSIRAHLAVSAVKVANSAGTLAQLALPALVQFVQCACLARRSLHGRLSTKAEAVSGKVR